MHTDLLWILLHRMKNGAAGKENRQEENKSEGKKPPGKVGRKTKRREITHRGKHMNTVRKTEKVYVKVNSDFDQTGHVLPRTITWSDGRVFRIEAVKDLRPASTLGKGRNGDCYTIIVQGEEKHLFFEKNTELYGSRIGRWFVERVADE